MSEKTHTLLEQFGLALTADIKSAIPKVTGKTANSVELHMDTFGFMIDANASLVTLIDGRKPTQSTTAGNPTLKEIIKQWIVDKGIVPKDGITIDTLAFLISRSIHRHGTKLYQMGGGNNLFANIITQQRIDTLAFSIAGAISVDIESDIVKSIKVIQ